MSRRILVILGHPNNDSYCAALAQSYVEGATSAGNEVKYIKLGDLSFDPVLHKGYTAIQELEPDLTAAQEAITWSEHMVYVYPIWWGSIPTLLKGFFDRAFLSDFAYKFKENPMFWDKLLKGRSAHLIVTMDTPPWYYRLFFRMPGHNQMKRTILEFCGVKPVKISSFGPIKGSSDKKRAAWIDKVNSFGVSA